MMRMKAAVPDIKVGNNSKIRDLSYPVAELMTCVKCPEPYEAGK
jgi:hypothetical protein